MPVCRGQQRDEGAPLETVAAYDLFHEKCGAGPVADVLQERDHQEQRNDLCQDLQHRSDTGDHALTEEVRQGVPWHIVLDEHTEPIEERRDRSLQRYCPGQDHLEEDEHCCEEREHVQHRVQQNPVHDLAAPVRFSALVQHGFQDRLTPSRALRRIRRRRQHWCGHSSACGSISLIWGMPVFFVPTTPTTGTPREACSRSRSTWPPRAASSSTMVRITRVGLPNASTCDTRISDRLIVVASATTINACGGLLLGQSTFEGIQHHLLIRGHWAQAAPFSWTVWWCCDTALRPRRCPSPGP